MLETLDLLVVVLPTVAGLIGLAVSLRLPPKEHHQYWFAALGLAGVVIAGLTLLQQRYAREARNGEVAVVEGASKVLADSVAKLQTKLDAEVARRIAADDRRLAAETTADQRVAAISQQLQVEVARREQAEKDLGRHISSVGDRTRQGVMEDFKSSPIRVIVNGQPTRSPDEMARVRDGLADFMARGAVFRDRCGTDAPGSTLESEAEAWFAEVRHYLRKNLGKAFEGQFALERLVVIGNSAIPGPRTALWKGLHARIEVLDSFINQLK